MRIGTHYVPARVTSLKHKVDVNTLEHIAAKTLGLNEIGLCNIATATPVAFDPYAENRDTGAFILIDRFTNATAGAGMITFGLRRATNIHRQALLVDKAARAAAERPQARRSSGSPVCRARARAPSPTSSSASCTPAARIPTCSMATTCATGSTATLGSPMPIAWRTSAASARSRGCSSMPGSIVLCSFISPFRAERRMVRELVGADEFIEIFVDTPIEECMRRDPKGLYARANEGKIKNFTGIDSPYEAPENPEIVVDTQQSSAEATAQSIMAALRARQIIG